MNRKNIIIFILLLILKCNFPIPQNEEIIEVYNINKTKSVKFAKNRKWIGFNKNFTINLNSIKEFKNLKSLEILSPSFSNLTNIQIHSNLTFLNLSHTSVQNLKPLNKLKKLKTLILTKSDVNETSFKNFSTSKLTKLFLSNINLTNINFIQDNCSLRVLDIRNTKVSNLNPLINCPKLIELKIGNSLVKNLDVILQLPNLNYLEMENIEVNKKILNAMREKNKWLKITF